MFILSKQITPHSIFWNSVPLKSPGIVESENFILRILHSYCVDGEYVERI